MDNRTDKRKNPAQEETNTKRSKLEDTGGQKNDLKEERSKEEQPKLSKEEPPKRMRSDSELQADVCLHATVTLIRNMIQGNFNSVTITFQNSAYSEFYFNYLNRLCTIPEDAFTNQYLYLRREYPPTNPPSFSIGAKSLADISQHLVKLKLLPQEFVPTAGGKNASIDLSPFFDQYMPKPIGREEFNFLKKEVVTLRKTVEEKDEKIASLEEQTKDLQKQLNDLKAMLMANPMFASKIQSDSDKPSEKPGIFKTF